MVTERVTLPEGVRRMSRRGGSWQSWVDALPALAAGLLEEWELRLDGLAQHGNVALVLPVRTADGSAGMLKISHPEPDSAEEHLALHRWDGRGAVRLLRADPARGALLLERLHFRKLAEVDDVEACRVVANLYSALHVAAPRRMRRLSTQIAQWAEETAGRVGDDGIPRRLREQALSLARGFATDADTDGVLVHTDLHYLNVLAADRAPWLAIDPKPLSGDPHYEVAPMLWNRWEEVVASGDVRGAVRRRFHTLVDTAGLDEARARDWVVVREIRNAVWGSDDPALGADWVTACIVVAKAVQE